MHCTQYIIGVAVSLVWDAYDSGRLWHCPPRVIDALQRLNLTAVLGYEGNADLGRLLRIISRVDWGTVSPRNNCRRRHGRDESPGRSTASGDFVYLDPTTGEILESWEARRRRDVRQDAFSQSSADAMWRQAYIAAPRTFAEVEKEAFRRENVPATAPTQCDNPIPPRNSTRGTATPTTTPSMPQTSNPMPSASPKRTRDRPPTPRPNARSDVRQSYRSPPSSSSNKPKASSPRSQRQPAGSSTHQTHRTPSGSQNQDDTQVPAEYAELPEAGTAAFDELRRRFEVEHEELRNAQRHRRERFNSAMPPGEVIDVDAEPEEGTQAPAAKHRRTGGSPEVVDLTAGPEPDMRRSPSPVVRQSRRRPPSPIPAPEENV